jgi:hypothetical protein
MRHTTINGHHVAHQTVAAFWIIAGIIAVIVVGDAFTLLALAIVTTAWWILSAVEHRLVRVKHRVERNDAEMAPVPHLRPPLTGQRGLKRLRHTRHGVAIAPRKPNV